MADTVYYKVESDMRWDQLAEKAYGDPHRMTDLLEANQEIGVYSYLPEGIVVACPVILDAAANPIGNLPEWKK